MTIYAIIKPGSPNKEGVLEGSGGTLVIYVDARLDRASKLTRAIELIAVKYQMAKSKVKLIREVKNSYVVFEFDK